MMSIWLVAGAKADPQVADASFVNSKQVDSEMQRGAVLERGKQYDEALSLYRKMADTQKEPTDSSKVQIKIGDVLLKQGKGADARKEYMKVLSNNSGKNRIYGLRAVDGVYYSYLQGNEFQKAEDYFADTIKKLGYSKNETALLIAQKQTVTKKWKRDSPEKEKIVEILEKYNDAVIRKDISAFKGIFVESIAEARISSMKTYFAKNPNETRRVHNIEINISDSGNTAIAEFQVDIGRSPDTGKTSQTREGVFKLTKSAGHWKVSE